MMVHLIKIIVFCCFFIAQLSFSQQQLLTTDSADAGYTLVEEYTDDTNGMSLGKDYSDPDPDRWCGLTTFEAENSETINALSVNILLTESPAQNITLSLCDSSGGSTPTPSNCVSTSAYDLSAAVAGWTPVLALTTGKAIVDGTDYIVQVTSDTIDATSYFNWRISSSGTDDYVRKNPSSGCSGTWVTQAGTYKGTYRLYK